MEKHRATEDRYGFPMGGESLVYGDKWAIAVPAGHFRDTGDRWATLEDFLRYCNVTQPPHIDRGLFT